MGKKTRAPFFVQLRCGRTHQSGADDEVVVSEVELIMIIVLTSTRIIVIVAVLLRIK